MYIFQGVSPHFFIDLSSVFCKKIADMNIYTSAKCIDFPYLNDIGLPVGRRAGT